LLDVPGGIPEFSPPRSISFPAPATLLQPADSNKAEDIKNATSERFMVFS
jgi:hypothetical protein